MPGSTVTGFDIVQSQIVFTGAEVPFVVPQDTLEVQLQAVGGTVNIRTETGGVDWPLLASNKEGQSGRSLSGFTYYFQAAAAVVLVIRIVKGTGS